LSAKPPEFPPGTCPLITVKFIDALSSVGQPDKKWHIKMIKNGRDGRVRRAGLNVASEMQLQTIKIKVGHGAQKKRHPD